MQQNKEKVTGQEMKDDIGPNSEKKLHLSAAEKTINGKQETFFFYS